MPRSFRLALGAAALMLLSTQALQADENLLGTWELTSMVMGGEPVHDLPSQVLIFAPTSFYAVGAEDHPINYVVSTDADPHAIDCSFGPGNAVTLYGIYRIEGDTLTLCINMPQPPEGGYESRQAPASLSLQQPSPMADRPTEFTSTAENGYQLQTFTRVPPATIQPSSE